MMSKKRLVAVSLLVLFAVISNILILKYVRVSSIENVSITLNIGMEGADSDYIQVFYNDELSFSEEESVADYYDVNNGVETLGFSIPNDNSYLRIDLGNKASKFTITDVSLDIYGSEYCVDVQEMFLEQHNLNQINVLEINNGDVYIETLDSDPYVLFMYDEEEIDQIAKEQIEKRSIVLNVIFCILIDIIVLVFIRKLKAFLELPLEVIKEKKLIWNLSKNDFKTKYAGSYLGIIWAFVQPVITVLVYWFVFEVGLKSGSVSSHPFILFLMCGLVPWFFFSDSLNGGTTALIEYNYLVKKVVFNISILPIVKAISALFVHVFFVVVVGVICIGYGYSVDLYWLQIPYYIICTMLLVFGLTYMTSAIVCFFRDLTQIISIILQIGMWVTPIMWQVSILPPILRTVFKLNPMYYVVEGYRNVFLDKAWFWEDATWTIYFWIVVVIGLGIGEFTFRKLKVHFADVL